MRSRNRVFGTIAFAVLLAASFLRVSTVFAQSASEETELCGGPIQGECFSPDQTCLFTGFQYECVSGVVAPSSGGTVTSSPTSGSTGTAPTSSSGGAPETVIETSNGASVEGGYQSILSNGIIFANICETPRPASGQPDSCACRAVGRCDLDDVLQIFVNISIFILGISGSIILLMFVYGGFLWITSRGDSGRVQKGKDTISQAVIGFAIILFSYTMINFAIAALAGDAPGATIEETVENAKDTDTTIDDRLDTE